MRRYHIYYKNKHIIMFRRIDVIKYILSWKGDHYLKLSMDHTAEKIW